MNAAATRTVATHTYSYHMRYAGYFCAKKTATANDRGANIKHMH